MLTWQKPPKKHHNLYMNCKIPIELKKRIYQKTVKHKLKSGEEIIPTFDTFMNILNAYFSWDEENISLVIEEGSYTFVDFALILDESNQGKDAFFEVYTRPKLISVETICSYFNIKKEEIIDFEMVENTLYLTTESNYYTFDVNLNHHVCVQYKE